MKRIAKNMIRKDTVANPLDRMIRSCIVIILIFPILLHEEDASGVNKNGPEEVKWLLAEVAGASVTALAKGRQPYILLDPSRKKASGFSGCNSFFAGYELVGDSLKFGSVGSTRRACLDPETAMETRFLKALEETREWKISDAMLLLLGDGHVLARFTMSQEDAPIADLGSMTFLSSWFPSGKVTLSHGKYREPAVPGSASEIIVQLSDQKAFGMVNGRKTGGVVTLASTGGTGTFYDLALLLREPKDR
ncbi:MAG: META domain-containing protein [Acidobacteriota bacterium]